MATTKLSDLINPQVMADMISAKINNAIVVTPYAKIDNTLVGQPGNKITVPQYAYIGDAADVAEGSAVSVTTLTATSVDYTIKKAMAAVELTDEAVLSAYGNPVGETNTQLAKAIASKIDADAVTALLTATQTYAAGAKISYSGVVDAIDVFAEELNTEKVMFVNPAQVTTLRKDTNFISADKYTEGGVVYTGEIGMIANTHIIPSRRIVKDASANTYVCPIVKIETDARTEDEVPALTIYKKRDANVETERDTLSRKTAISVDEHYVVALTNASKVVLATFNA